MLFYRAENWAGSEVVVIGLGEKWGAGEHTALQLHDFIPSPC